MLTRPYPLIAPDEIPRREIPKYTPLQCRGVSDFLTSSIGLRLIWAAKLTYIELKETKRTLLGVAPMHRTEIQRARVYARCAARRAEPQPTIRILCN